MQKNSDFNKPSIIFNTKDRESTKDYDRIHSTDKKINIKETVEKKNSYDKLISLGWKEEKEESNFSLLSKNQSGLDKDFKLFESFAFRKIFGIFVWELVSCNELFK